MAKKKQNLTYIYLNHTTKTVIAITAKSRAFADKNAGGAIFQYSAYGEMEAYGLAKQYAYDFLPIQLF